MLIHQHYFLIIPSISPHQILLFQSHVIFSIIVLFYVKHSSFLIKHKLQFNKMCSCFKWLHRVIGLLPISPNRWLYVKGTAPNTHIRSYGDEMYTQLITVYTMLSVINVHIFYGDCQMYNQLVTLYTMLSVIHFHLL